MKRPSARGAWLGFGVLGLAAGVLGGCRSAAEVFLDVPPPQPKTGEASAVASSPAPDAFPVLQVANTVRPAIESLESPDSVLAALPRAHDGGIDWLAAAEDGVIQPRATLPGSLGGTEPAVFGFDFFVGEFEAYFPHSSHTELIRCESCHPEIFRKRGVKTSMQEISEGKSCGACHGPVAFPVPVCERCHTALQGEADRVEPSLGPEVALARGTESDEMTEAAGSDFPPSVFSHGTHRIRFACSACHPKIAPMRKAPGGTFRMDEMQAGASCGACHDDKTAFGIMECGRCHRPPRQAAD